MKVASSVTVFQDSVGMRMSVTYSEVDEISGVIKEDNKRINRIMTDATMKKHAQTMLADAQAFVDAIEE